MKKITVAWSIILVLLAVGMLSADVNVTFRVNASTVEGFTDSTEVLQIRGGNAPLTWDGTSPALTNVGGDYWEAVVTFPGSGGDEIHWKIAGTRIDLLTGQESEFWEVIDPDHRIFILPAQDTVLNMAYISNNFDPPYTPSDSIDIFFRVNMVALGGFDPEDNALSIVGAFPHPDGSDNMWNPGNYRLTREGTSNYWNYHLKIPTPLDSVMYRFHNGVVWDGVPSESILGHGMFPDNDNRGVTISNDTTLAWKWWNDMPLTVGDDSMMVQWKTDLTLAAETNGWSLGDTVLVRYGDNNTAVFGTDTLVWEFSTNLYITQPKWITGVTLGDQLYYNYYIINQGTNIREAFYDFDFSEGGAEGEKRKFPVIASPGSELQMIMDNEDSETSMRRMPKFPNSDPLPKEVTVIWECDLRPAYFHCLNGDTIIDGQGNRNYGPGNVEDIITDGVCI
ncbi:MAG: hypothetical protein KAR38_08295, partial [Calditrichia bacterium]|nr:hypothetical protein [Calditrichia bacterium]